MSRHKNSYAYRLPSGEKTYSADVYAKAWMSFGDRVARLFGPRARIRSFDPGIIIEVDGGVAHLDIEAATAMVETWESTL